ncbi:class I adenylate-forming enzyme family protein [Endozoicomonas arenosclerae]|uniref:class I adenylate-forming enzyme family protein n=1 Tax=Endozoicomonas arenosclerae TaxID=1633495 RepID=UPI00078671E4|nr:class I adenylate-forming enzyme family protein [Endozoicomonas arenosclerae]
MSQSIAALKAVVSGLTQPGGQFEMEDTQNNGIQYRSFKNAPATLTEIYEASTAFGDAPFLVYQDETYSFKEVFELSQKLSASLVQQGVKKGDRVAIAMRNCPEWVIAFIAATSAGAIAVALNSWGEADELEYGLSDSGASLVFVDGRRLELLSDKLDDLGVKAVAVRVDGELPANTQSWQQVVESGASAPSVQISSEDPAFIMYTSGTTGRPKGALTSHRAAGQAIMCGSMAGMVVASQHPKTVERLMARGKPTAIMLSLPLFHGSGLITVIFNALRGGTKVVMQAKWDPEDALKLIEKEGVGTLSGAAKMIWDLLEHPEFDKYDTSSIFSMTGVGAAQPETLVKDILNTFPDNFLGTGYGMTESNMFATLNTGPAYQENKDSVGLPYPVTDIKVVDDQGKELPVGEVGEICIKGPTLVDGYWGKKEATEGTIIDGWLHGGDIGYLGENGLVYVCDRKKDMVIRGGENIYCVEVEAVINAHTDVDECAVFGVPHERWGEELAVTLKLKGNSELSEEDLKEHVSRHLAKFKVPAYVHIASESLPRNAMQKILKHEVRRQYLEKLA